MRQGLKDVCILLLFLLLLPYVMGIMNKTREEGVSWMNMETVEEEEETTNFIKYEDKLFVQEIPMEEFLIGALAGTIPIDYQPEVLKAQAVLLRSTCYTKLKNEGTISGQEINKKMIEWEKVSSGYLTQSQMKQIWKGDYEANYQRAAKAVKETRGIIITYKENPIEGVYHAMSGGKTRNGMDLLVGEEYGYLEGVLCEKNVESEDFLQNVEISKEQIQTLSIENRDQAGYVLTLFCNNKKMTGEQFRNEYQLSSANFTFEETDDKFIITTRGIGHGLGMDQYYGELLAENGYSYTEILDYFFKDTKLSKITE